MDTRTKYHEYGSMALAALVMALLVWFWFPTNTYAVTNADFAKKTQTLAQKYQNAPKGGIVLAGSSSFSQWTTAQADLRNSIEALRDAVVLNFGIGGATSSQWCNKTLGYMQAIAAKQPSVVVVYGANILVRSKTDAGKNTELVKTAVKNLQAFVKGVSTLCQRPPKFILVSTINAPSYYKVSGRAGASHSGYCILWDRFDDYNKQMQQLAVSGLTDNKKRRVSLTYLDLAQYYYYRTVKTKTPNLLRYYLGDPKDASNVTNAKTLLARMDGKICPSPWFKADLCHPSRAAYKKIWAKHLGKWIVTLLHA